MGVALIVASAWALCALAVYLLCRLVLHRDACGHPLPWKQEDRLMALFLALLGPLALFIMAGIAIMEAYERSDWKDRPASW